jgi:hypothetical protein
MATTSYALVSRASIDPLPADGPVPSLIERISELLRVEKNEVVVDLYGSDLQSPTERMEPNAFSERLAFLLTTSGVRMVQMDALNFGRFPMRYAQVVLRDGFSQSRGSLRRLLVAVLGQLDPSGRVLVVDSAPSADAPVFETGLRRWNRRHRSPEVIAALMRTVGFSARVETLECPRRVSTAACFAWVKSRSWPLLDRFDEAELQRGLCELRDRYGSRPVVEFTSRYDLVLGTKPENLAS